MVIYFLCIEGLHANLSKIARIYFSGDQFCRYQTIQTMMICRILWHSISDYNLFKSTRFKYLQSTKGWIRMHSYQVVLHIYF